MLACNKCARKRNRLFVRKVIWRRRAYETTVVGALSEQKLMHVINGICMVIPLNMHVLLKTAFMTRGSGVNRDARQGDV